jgi:hypothetical protein
MTDFRVFRVHNLDGRRILELVLVTPLAEFAENCRKQHAALGVWAVTR